MSNSSGFIRRMIPLGLCTFLWAGSPATAITLSPEEAAGLAELAPGSVTDVRAKINSQGTSVTVSWELSEDDMVRRVPIGGDITSGGIFVEINGVESYRIWRQGAEDTEPTLAGTVNAGETSFVDESFALGTTYTYSVTATAPAGDNESAPTAADTPIDVGPPPAVRLTVDQASLGEGDGVATVTVTATLSRAWSLNTPVELSISDAGTAEQAEGRDYTAEWTGQLTIAAGESEGSATLLVSVNDDNLAEGDIAETILLEGTSAVSGGANETADLDVAGTEITLTDNDVAPTSITLTVDTANLDEGAGETAVEVTATLGDGSTALLTDTAVALSLSGTHVDLGPDYEASEVTITIPAEQTGASSTLTLTPNDDNLAEGDETIEVSGAADGFTVESASIGLTDNDVAPTSITLEVDASTFGEGDGDATITVTATLGDGSTALLNDTEVALAVAESDENAAAAGAVTIAARETSASGSITLTILEENLVDGDKTIALVGTAAGYDIGDIELTVTDNDVAPTSITLEVDASTFGEGDGDATITVTATLGDGSTALLNDTEVALAVAESDENAAAAGAVTIAARETSASGSITLTILEENLVDGDKTIALVGTAAGYDIGDIELTVTDNDVAPTSITLEVDASTFGEGDGDATITVTATLGDGSTALLNDTEVALAVAESDENAAAAGAVTIAARETSASGSITLTILEENLVDGDKTIALVGTAAGYDIGDIELTVTDNDVAPTSITLEVDASTFGEGDGDATITVTATLGDGSTALLNDTEVALAVAESDENAAAAGAVTIAARETSASGSITLTILEENLVDGDKTIALVGTAAGYDIGDIELTVTDNDVAPTSITLEVDASTFGEGDGDATITVTATLGDGSTALLNDTEVALAVAESDENAAAGASVTIAARETSSSQSLSLTLKEENLVDGDKIILLTGTAAGYDIGDVELTVTDNDVAPTSITLEVDASTFGEGDGDATITVTATLGDGSTALLNDTEVALAVAESDENAAAAGAVTIAARETSASGSITLTILEENLVDGDKTIALVGTAAGYDIGDIELTVTDNDVAPTSITLEVDASTFGEGDGDATITVTATLGDGSTALLNDTEVALAVAESDENAAAAGAVTIAARETSASGSITLTILEENLVDGDKTIALVGTAAGYDIGDIELTVTDNDVAPTSITLEVDASTFGEGDGDATITVTATLGDGSTALLNDTEVALAVAESDENAAAGASVTIAARETSSSQSLSLTLKEENLVDGDKIILLTGTAAGYDIGDVELTVTDNDVAPTTITLSVDTDSFDEGDGETAVTVTAVLGDGSTALLNDTQITLSLSGTAEDGSDYTASIPTITVAAEQTSGSGVLALTPPDELIPEYEETIVVEGAADGFTVASATIAITDNDDEPTVVNPIPAMILYVGGAEGVMELSDKFRGLDMTYSATSSAPGVATVSVEGSQVTVSAVIEGESSIEVTAMNTIGPDASQAFAVTVMTEPNETQIVGDALAAIGRTTLSSVSSAIGTRFASRPSSTMMTLAGYSLLSKGGAPHLGARGFGLQPELRYAQASRNEMSWKRALRNTSFAVPMGEGGGSDPGLPNWTLWGLGDYNTFEGTPDYGSHSGTVTSVYLGVDKSVAQRAQLGVTVSYSMGETDYDFEGVGASGSGALTTVLTSVYPYLRFAPSAGMDIWALGGVGVGTAENERGVTSTTEESDLAMTLGLLGARQSLGTMGGLDMALRGDAGMVNLSTAEGEGVIADQAVAAQRFRLGVEGAHTFQMASCAKVTPYGELSGRFDGGDGQTGGGLEAAGGLRYECPRSRFRFEARGRILALNSAYSESGGSVMASYSPGADGLGLSMALAPHWGAAGGGAQALWRDDSFRTIGRLGSLRDDWSMDAQVGYGMRVQPLPGVLTPFAQFMPAGTGEQMRLGVRFEGLGGTAFEMLDLNLSAGRVDRRQRYAEHRVDVRGAMYF